jgi:signal peptidase I
MRSVERHRRDEALREANRGRRGSRAWKRAGARITSWLVLLPAAFVLFLGLRTFVVEAFRIPSSSMERTLLVGDFLLVNKWVYGAEIPFTRGRLPALRSPQYNDVVVFDWPVDPAKAFVKRLIGLPGDTLTMQQGVLRRNGVLLQEPYVFAGGASAGVYDTTLDARDSWGPLVVPPRHLFVLGDNRANSLDSRYWGFVPDSLLRGAPWIVYYSFTPDSTERAPWLTRIRWDRIGTSVR